MVDAPEPDVVRTTIADDCVADCGCKAGLQGGGEEYELGQHDQEVNGRS